jgi:hypothetical protein
VLKTLRLCEELEASAARMTALLRALVDGDGFVRLWCMETDSVRPAAVQTRVTARVAALKVSECARGSEHALSKPV